MKQKHIFKVLIFCALNSGIYCSWGQSVVINEVITDPQTDWSTNNFDGTNGNGTISNVDEAIELYIKTDGLNLTNWTIELLDGTDVTGDLTDSGAFDVSNYISNNGGTFSNTKNGDYLVLGNVNSSGLINNSITINLKDSNASLIDTVTLGLDPGEAPYGSASSASNESVQRIPNGEDTNNDSIDFKQGEASLGSSNPSSILSSKSTDFSITSVYPNPVISGKIHIKSSNSEIKNIVIYNILGRKLLATKVVSNQEINVSDLNTGIYILRIQEADKLLTKKIIIK